LSNKKDLTSIEDLGEYVHELEPEDFSSSLDEDLPSEVPDLPTSHDSFSTEEGAIDFGSAEEPEFTSSFRFSEDATIDSESTSLETQDFNSEFTLSEEDEESEDNYFSKAQAFSEPEPEPEPEVESESEPEEEIEVAPYIEEPVYTPSKEFKTPETFEDLKKFSESSSFTGMATEGNPSFSVLIKNVRYIEDVNDITSLLKEFKLMADSEELTKGRLMRGMLLVPRISEYAAIFLAHKLRRFDVDLQVGLSDEIHPPKHQETPETGIVSKHNLFQNQNHHFHFDDPKLEISQIIVAATPSLEGHQVVRYVGVASEHKMLESTIVEDENSTEIPRYYQELAQKLKAHALKANANAVVGLNYQLTPIPSEYGISGHKYRLTCTGNLVWVTKL
jgi:uncharacterized protein YbjQ (UPF0145 family)